MKVLLVNKFHYEKGGSERYYFNLAKGFLDAGDSVIYFAMQSDKNLDSQTKDYFVKEKNVNGSFLQKIKFIFSMNYSKEAYSKMYSLVEKEKPDLVILNLVHKHLTTSIIKAIKDYDKNIPILWTMHDYITVCPAYTMLNGKGENCEDCLTLGSKCVVKNKCIGNSTLQSILAKREYDFIRKKGYYNLVDAYICPSQFMLNALERGNFTTSKLVKMYNPILDEICVAKHKEGGEYLLFVGRLESYKGVRLLLSAVKDTDKKVVIVGTGPEEKALKEYALDNNINAEFVGYKNQEEVFEYFKNAKAVVIPSLWQENCPYVALESMARATPIIANSVGGLKELVFVGKNGYLFSDLESLKTVIEKIYSLSKEEYIEMSKNCLQVISEQFNMQKYIENLKNIINK